MSDFDQGQLMVLDLPLFLMNFFLGASLPNIRKNFFSWETLFLGSLSKIFLFFRIKIGLFCNTPGIALARNLPRKLAMDMLLTAREITAQEALNFGLISRLVEDGKAKEEVLSISEEICKYSRNICGLGKAFFYTQIEQNIATANRQGATVMCNNLKLPDAKEGISAFLQKRKPKWVE
uniref:Enoyl-CoA hydratase domain-containing protein 3, mitochondrial n=1 Tax=Meloidogyne incognita TaxID=6306 RepID=A0A914LPI1_MELIC